MTQTPRSTTPYPRRSDPGLSKRLAVAELLSEQLQVLGIPADSWQYVIAGDGSGTTWEHSAGWAGVIYDQRERELGPFCGCWSHATNTVAEMMVVIQSLAWLEGYKHRQRDRQNVTNVWVLTDNEYVAEAGNRRTPRKVNRALWGAIDASSGVGIRTRFRWIPRDTLRANIIGHELSNILRKFLVEYYDAAVRTAQRRSTKLLTSRKARREKQRAAADADA